MADEEDPGRLDLAAARIAVFEQGQHERDQPPAHPENQTGDVDG